MSFDKATLADLRKNLTGRRYRIVETANLEDQEADALRTNEGPRPSEYEESAQRAASEYALDRLSDNQRTEVAQIDAAIARIDAGTYGKCSECGEEIEVERLRAIPYASLCAVDAGSRERSPRSLAHSVKI